MTEEDYKAVIAGYQQKSFELFNQTIVLEAQVNNLKKSVDLLSAELEKLRQEKNTRKGSKPTDDF